MDRRQEGGFARVPCAMGLRGLGGARRRGVDPRAVRDHDSWAFVLRFGLWVECAALGGSDACCEQKQSHTDSHEGDIARQVRDTPFADVRVARGCRPNSASAYAHAMHECRVADRRACRPQEVLVWPVLASLAYAGVATGGTVGFLPSCSCILPSPHMRTHMCHAFACCARLRCVCMLRLADGFESSGCQKSPAESFPRLQRGAHV